MPFPAVLILGPLVYCDKEYRYPPTRKASPKKCERSAICLLFLDCSLFFQVSNPDLSTGGAALGHETFN